MAPSTLAAKTPKISPKDVYFAPTTVPTGLTARCIHWRGMYVGEVVLSQGKWFAAHSTAGHADILDAVAILVARYQSSWAAKEPA